MDEKVICTSDAPSEAYTILRDYQFSDEKTCAVCGIQTNFTCTTCHGIAYCGQAHELQDREYHLLICSAAASIPPRPSGDHWVAILVLPEHSKTPYYEWTQYKLNRHNLPVFEQSLWYGENYRSRPTFILRHPITRQTLPHAIMNFELVHNSKSGKGAANADRAPATTNLCVHNLTGGVNSSAFRGTLLPVTLARTADKEKTWLLSFKPQDIHLLIEELKQPEVQTTKSIASGSIKGVACYPSLKAKIPKLNLGGGDSTGDRNGAESVTFESLEIPKEHPILTSSSRDPQIYTPPLGKVYNFPIRMFRYLNYPGPFGNNFVSTIFPTIEIISDNQGNAHRPIALNSRFTAETTGAVLFARTDGKPLEIEHLKEFSTFVEHVTNTWRAYDTLVNNEADTLEKFRRDRTGSNPMLKGFGQEEMDLVVDMDKTLDQKAFWEFWKERHEEGDEGPFKGIDMNGVDLGGAIDGDSTEEEVEANLMEKENLDAVSV